MVCPRVNDEAATFTACCSPAACPVLLHFLPVLTGLPAAGMGTERRDPAERHLICVAGCTEEAGEAGAGQAGG